jgi:hypothetical protein
MSGVGSLSEFRASFGQFSPVSCTRARSFREDRLPAVVQPLGPRALSEQDRR